MNEMLFLALMILEGCICLVLFRINRKLMRLSIVINLLLISTLGAKLVPVFGVITNVGLIFYATVFLSTHMLIERYGRREGYRVMWVGFIASAMFVILSSITLAFWSAPSSPAINGAIDTLFKTVPRVALGSILAYLVAQYINISVYSYFLSRHKEKHLWLRDTVANLLGQLIDTIIFFVVAFLQVLPWPVLLQSILFGYLIKVLAGFVGLPFLYASRKMKVEELGYM